MAKSRLLCCIQMRPTLPVGETVAFPLPILIEIPHCFGPGHLNRSMFNLPRFCRDVRVED